MEVIMFENFRKENGDFPSNVKCSQCYKSSEVYAELYQGSIVMRLCKGCLSDYIDKINKCYVNKMSKSK